MKKLITILLVIICQDSFCQNYVGYWNNTGAKIDSVQQSMDGKNFKTIQIVFGGVDSAIVSGPTYFYRIKSGSNISNVVLVASALPVDITNLSCVNHVFSFTTQNETNLKELDIEETADGVNYVITKVLVPNGNSVYQNIIQ